MKKMTIPSVTLDSNGNYTTELHSNSAIIVSIDTGLSSGVLIPYNYYGYQKIHGMSFSGTPATGNIGTINIWYIETT